MFLSLTLFNWIWPVSALREYRQFLSCVCPQCEAPEPIMWLTCISISHHSHNTSLTININAFCRLVIPYVYFVPFLILVDAMCVNLFNTPHLKQINLSLTSLKMNDCEDQLSKKQSPLLLRFLHQPLSPISIKTLSEIILHLPIEQCCLWSRCVLHAFQYFIRSSLRKRFSRFLDVANVITTGKYSVTCMVTFCHVVEEILKVGTLL